MESQCWSYLNEEYNQAVLDTWVDQGCAGVVSRRLGYRLSLVSATMNEAVAPGGVLDVDLEITNQGFSAPFNRRPIALVLRHGSQRWQVTLASRDARQLQPGTTIIKARLRIPADAPPADDYELALWMPDDNVELQGNARYSIRLANEGVWDDATGVNTITRTLRVDASTLGDVDPDASGMEELPR